MRLQRPAMPIDPEGFLELAKTLIGPSPGASEAELRRGVSTAYYALFHLLIKETVSNFVNDAAFGARLGRAFQHGSMRAVCEKYRGKLDRATAQYVVAEGNGFPSQVIPPGVQAVAEAFVSLHTAREKADYDDATTVSHADALADVQKVENAFQAWLTVQTDPSASIFLQRLMIGSVTRR